MVDQSNDIIKNIIFDAYNRNVDVSHLFYCFNDILQ